ncbi:helix-turn-helix domain-containing protein [Bacillus cereus]|uniref:helix-turn-helix domain-containing protein n=1 Tax=Bacillus cereus TaxID=1396 RepID=UPI002409782F|nr:helix-turn-helix domain-containing protein [Bacillus cereus]HDR7002796.1 helix-turn-helix domain-containing protein [Bacillus cereus]HDR7021365.1 helix-turn-helix domain-containing protein [Bacillus cereus]
MLIKRQYHILQHLVNEDRWFSMIELARKLNCSIKTVQRDMVYLQKNLPEKWFIKYNKKKGVRLFKPFNSSIDNINYLYLRHTLLFKTLEILMSTDVGSISLLAEKLYIQNKKVKKIFKDVELHLNKYQLSLKRRPLRIAGNNIKILLMYHELYLSAYSDTEWPFEDINRELCIEFLAEVEKLRGIKFYKETKKEISFFIALYLKRKYRGYSVVIKHWQIKKIEKLNEYTQLKKIIENIFKKYNFQLSTVDIAIILTIINRSEYTYKRQNYIKSIHSVTEPLCPFVKKFIRNLEKNLKVELLNDIKFIQALSKTLTYSVKVNNNLFSDYTKNNTFITHIKKTHYSIYCTVSKQLTDLKITYDKLNIPINISIHNTILLTMYIATKKMELKRKNPQVLLYTKKGEYWKLYLQAFFSITFKKGIDFLDIKLENLTKSHLEYANISCVITDTFIECKHIPVILISSIPTQRDLEEIKKFL